VRKNCFLLLAAALLAASTVRANPIIDPGSVPPRPNQVPPGNVVPVVVEVRDGEAQPYLVVPRSLLHKGRRVASAGSFRDFATTRSFLIVAGLGLSLLLAFIGLHLVRSPERRLQRRSRLLLLALLSSLLLGPLAFARAPLPNAPLIQAIRLNVEGVEIRGGVEGMPIRLVLPRAEVVRLAKELAQPVTPATPVVPGAAPALPGG
jgi:hypothetical protein